MCILFSKWIYITDNNRITYNNMKYWSKFRPNGRITQRIYILSILVVCIQYKYSIVADRIYTKKWHEGKNLSHYAGTLFSARGPDIGSLCTHQSSCVCHQWHFFFTRLLSSFGLPSGIKEQKTISLSGDLTSLQLTDVGVPPLQFDAVPCKYFSVSHLCEISTNLPAFDNCTKSCCSMNTEKEELYTQSWIAIF